MDSSVTIDIQDNGVASVCLNRPEKHNAFDDSIIAEINECVQNLAQDKRVKLVVLRSNGKSFSAGADLNWMKRMASYGHEDNLKDARALAEMLHSLYSLPKPTIALIQGAAFGGAVGLASCCDVALASTQASFSLSEVKIGLIPATISPYVIEAIGARASRRYFQSGERFSAERAMSLGLVSEVCEPENLETELDALVNTLLANGPEAMAQAKQLVADFSNQTITPALIEDSCERIASIRVSPEGQEGLSAFLEKRPANWKE